MTTRKYSRRLAPESYGAAAALALLACACGSLVGLDDDPDADPDPAGSADGGVSGSSSGAATGSSGTNASSSGQSSGGESSSGQSSSSGGGSSGSSSGGGPADPGWTRWTVSDPFPVVVGAALDPHTGLQWSQDLPDEMGSNAAIDACNALDEGGHQDWRMPTRIELLSITTYVPGASAHYWTQTSYAPSPERRWEVDLGTGFTSHPFATDDAHVRCVRAGNPGPNGPDDRFVGSTETVHDSVTNLTWEVGSEDAVPLAYAAATARCATIELDGATGFRVPTVHELHSLIDERRATPALDPRFVKTASGHWSATPASTSGYYWVVNDYDGDAHPRDGSTTAGLRCVK